jgi:hypothetical protein
VEDASGGKLLERVVPRIICGEGGEAEQDTTFRIHTYKGIGHIPKGLKPGDDPQGRLLLDQLPRLLRGYGRSLKGVDAAVVVIVDQDSRSCRELKQDMVAVLRACDPKPTALLRIAIEEIEAWLLGDRAAIERAYPKAKRGPLNEYVQDAVCGTWEILADAVYPGGSKALGKRGYPVIGQVKREWAERIGPELDEERNASKSFQVFRDGLRRLARKT